MARVELYHIESVRKLGGDAFVTYPDGATGVRRVERVFRVQRGTPPKAYKSPQTVEYTDTKLVEQRVIGGNQVYVEIYQAWETLPGTEVPSKRVNERGDVETTVVQHTATDTAPDADSLLTTGSSIEAINAVVGTRTVSTVASHATLTSKAFDAEGSLETSANDIVAPSTDPTDGLLVNSDSVTSTTKTKATRVRATVASRPVITSKRVNERGDTATRTEQTVAPDATLTADGLTVLETRLDGKTVTKSRKISESVASHSTLTSKAFDNEGALETSTNAIVAPSTTPTDSLLTNKDSVTAKSATKSVQETSTVASRPTITSVRVNDRGDTATRTEQTVAAGTSADADSLTVLEARVDGKTVTKSRKIKESVASHSTLTSKRFDDQGALETSTNDIVAPATDPVDGLLVNKDSVTGKSATKSVQERATVASRPVITSKRLDDRGDTETTTEQVVAPATSLDADSINLVSTSLTGRTSTKSLKKHASVASRSTLTSKSIGDYGQTITTTETYVDPVSQDPEPGLLVVADDIRGQTVAKGVRKRSVSASYPQLGGGSIGGDIGVGRFLGTVSTTFKAVAPDTAIPSGFLVTSADLDYRTTYLSVLKTKTTDEFKTLTSSKVDPEAHGATSTTVENIVAPDAALTSGGLLVLDSSIDALDYQRSKKTVKTIEAWPELTGYDIDQQTGIVIEVNKTFVDASTAAGGIIDGYYVEIQPYDKWKSIQIRSKISGDLPDDETWATMAQRSLPDVLTSASAVVYASGDSLDADIMFTIQDGFSGSMAGTVVRKYLSAAPTTAIVATNFTTGSHRAVFKFSNGSNYAKVKGLYLPPTLHAGFNLHVTGSGTSGSSSWVIDNNAVPATTYTGYASGATFIHSAHVEKWRLGVWVQEVTTATIP